MTRNVVQIATIVAVALTVQITGIVKAQEQAAPTTENKSLATSLVGTWMLAGDPAKPGVPPEAVGRLLHLTGRHWTITQPDPKTGVTVFHHGGTYTLDGNEYAETVEYANENTAAMIKQTFKFTVKVEGDTLTKIGIGNPWSEVWKRAK